MDEPDAQAVDLGGKSGAVIRHTRQRRGVGFQRTGVALRSSSPCG